MNLFFGILGETPADTGEMETRVSAAYDAQLTAMSECDGARAWVSGDGGASLGMAQHDGAALVYIGVILGGAPGWDGAGSPLDDPDQTADWLLRRYFAQGLSFLDGIPGTYIVHLQDRAKGRALLATDPGGGHSLYIRNDHGAIQFGSNLSLMPTAFDRITMDRGLEDFLLGYQFLPDGRTVYSGVTALPGGTLLEWQGGEEKRHKIAPWSGDAPDLSQASLDESIDALHEGFMQALEDVAPTHSKVAVMLGGFDSALVAAGLKQMGREVHSFTFHFADESFNQPHTDTLVEAVGHTHHWVPITSEVIADGLRNYARRFNLTAVQPHYPIESVEVCRLIREAGMLHAVTGDGCDGLFLGYPTIYRRTRVVNALTKIPSPLRALASGVLGSRFLEKQFGHPWRVARNLNTMLKREPLVRDHFAARALDNYSLDWARGGKLAQERDVEQILHDLAQPVAGLSRVRRAYHSKGLAGSNRNKMEGCFDVTGIAVTSPFTHPRFAKLAGSMDDEMSRPGEGNSGLGKHALMEMAVRKGLLPAEIVHQPKRSPAEAPVDRWYMGELCPLMEEKLAELPFEIDKGFADSLLSRKLTEDMFRKRVALDTIASHALTALVTYAAYNGVLRERAA